MTVLTLRPNSDQDIHIPSTTGTSHYTEVDEATPDDADYVYDDSRDAVWKYDLYGIPNHTTEIGIINNVKIYIRCRGGHSSDQCRTAIKSDSTITYGTAHSPGTTNTNYSETYTTNPADSSAWTWTDIDNLQIGVSLYSYDNKYSQAKCSNVYVEIDYTPATRKTKTYNFNSLLKATKSKNKLMDIILELTGNWKEEKFPVLIDQYATSSNYYNNDNLEWGNSDEKRAFMRFQPNMPKSVIIREAFIEVSASQDQSDNMITEINRLSSSNVSFDQNLFSANVDTNTNKWKTPEFEISETYKTATVTDLLQEFIDDSDYNESDYLPIRFINTSAGIRKIWQ